MGYHSARGSCAPAGNEVKEETYEKTNFELFDGAGPVPDAAAHHGAGGGGGAGVAGGGLRVVAGQVIPVQQVGEVGGEASTASTWGSV